MLLPHRKLDLDTYRSNRDRKIEKQKEPTHCDSKK